MSGNTVPFVEYKGFLKAALDFGIDVESGIKELIDNSIDARATIVRVILDTKHNVQDQTTGIVHERVMRIFVVDDGHGIPATVEDAGTGIEYPGLPFVLSLVDERPTSSPPTTSAASAGSAGAFPPRSPAWPKSVVRASCGPSRPRTPRGAPAVSLRFAS